MTFYLLCWYNHFCKEQPNWRDHFMNKTHKLIISILAMIIVIILMGFGIWAVLADIGIGSDITFEIGRINADISGKVYGHHKDHLTQDQAEQLPGGSWTQQSENPELDWSGLNLTFADKDMPIVIEVNITNTHQTQDLSVVIENKTNTNGKNFSLTMEVFGEQSEGVIGTGETARYVFTLRVLDANKSVSGNLELIFRINNII